MIIGVAGIIIGIIIAQKERKKNRSIYWNDLSHAVESMAISMRREFTPDIILIPNEKGCILARLLKPYFQQFIPCIVGIGIDKKSHTKEERARILNAENDYVHFETSKWYAYIPRSILGYKDKKVLLLDDFAMSGDYIYTLKDQLKAIGFIEDNIKIAQNRCRGGT